MVALFFFAKKPQFFRETLKNPLMHVQTGPIPMNGG